MNINEYCKIAHQDAIRKGFYEDGERNYGELIALITSELSESLEAHRKNDWASKDIRDFVPFNQSMEEDFKESIKDSIEDEIADAVIRIFDLCGYLDIDLEGHIEAKMGYNRLRPKRHGKRY